MQPEGFRIVPSTYTERDNSLEVKGSYTFSITNKGTSTAFIWGNVELLPGERISFDNIYGLPYAENASLEFSGGGENKILLIKAVKIKLNAACGDR